MAVDPAGEHDAWDRGNGSRLRGAAARNVVAARVWRLPDLLTRLNVQRIQASAHLIVQQKRNLLVER
jgi:hypothetical protein